MRRGPTRRLGKDQKFTVTELSNDGLPIEPKRTRDAFSAQRGAIVTDNIPISIKQWNKPKGDNVPKGDYVTDRLKDDLWTALKENFTLPLEEDPNKLVIESLVKACALKKMAELFRRWKNELKTFVDKEETPQFTGRFEKIRYQGPAFMAHKTSEKSKKMSVTNKKNAVKKKHHHRTGSGGYLKA